MMKILRVTPHYYLEAGSWPSRFDPIGGMQVQIKEISEWLALNDVVQDVLTTGLPSMPRYIEYSPNLRIHSVRVATLPLKSRYTGTVFLDQSWALGCILWARNALRNGHSYDALHVHASGVVWPLLVAEKIHDILDLPIVLSIHCSRRFTYAPMNHMDRLMHQWAKRVEDRVISQSSKVIVLTDAIRNSYVNYTGDESKFMTISDSIAPSHLNHSSTHNCFAVKQRFGIPADSRMVLFVGRIAEEKGWKTFVEVAKRLAKDPSLVFVVCGDGPQRRELGQLIESYGLKQRFIITGFISHKIVPCIMSSASVLVMPSKHEELGGAALEGAVANVPVVASNVGGLAKIFQNNETALLVECGAVQQFVAAVEMVLYHYGVAQKLTQNARCKVVPRFTPENTIPKYFEVYNSVT